MFYSQDVVENIVAKGGVSTSEKRVCRMFQQIWMWRRKEYMM
jgi:hypothetical protein